MVCIVNELVSNALKYAFLGEREGTVERAKLAFPFKYILKPVREQELYAAIQTALNLYSPDADERT